MLGLMGRHMWLRCPVYFARSLAPFFVTVAVVWIDHCALLHGSSLPVATVFHGNGRGNGRGPSLVAA